MLKVNYVEDTRPIKSVTLEQPKGTLDLTLNKNSSGTRIRIANEDGNVVNVAVAKIPDFISALNKIAKFGAKVSQKTPARTARNRWAA